MSAKGFSREFLQFYCLLITALYDCLGSLTYWTYFYTCKDSLLGHTSQELLVSNTFVQYRLQSRLD